MPARSKKNGRVADWITNDEIDNESGDESFVNEFTNRV